MLIICYITRFYLPTFKFIFIMNERLSRVLQILHQNMVVQAEQAQVHGPLQFSSHPRLTTNRCPLWPGGTLNSEGGSGEEVCKGTRFGLEVI